MQATTVGALFTDEFHNIIFMDHHLRQILNDQDDLLPELLGTPVHTIFGFSKKQYDEFLARYRVSNSIPPTPLDLYPQIGEHVPVVLQGTINLDDRQKFMGVDYQIESASKFVAPIHVGELSDPLIAEIMRMYCKNQLAGLFALAVEWGGAKSGQFLNRLVNETASQHGWQIQMQHEQVTIASQDVSEDEYYAILSKAAAYVAHLFGPKLVEKQIHVVNSHTNPKTFDYFDGNWFKIS
jgi:hypothetical protein